MEDSELKNVLERLLDLEAETEVVEFKEAKENFDFRRLGKYFSALSNEANLKRKSCGWLVFGIEDKRHAVVGSKYRLQRKELDHLKGEIANKTTNRITFIEIHGLKTSQTMMQKAEYSKNKALDKQYYLDFILAAIKDHGSMSRRDIDELLWNKLPEWMSDVQKKNKVRNLIKELREKGRIVNNRTRKESNWEILSVS